MKRRRTDEPHPLADTWIPLLVAAALFLAACCIPGP